MNLQVPCQARRLATRQGRDLSSSSTFGVPGMFALIWELWALHLPAWFVMINSTRKPHTPNPQSPPSTHKAPYTSEARSPEPRDVLICPDSLICVVV